jgi:nucleoside-diphosphate-sugar epimerase
VEILVTGASGFLGRQVCRELVERGHAVAGLVRREGSEPSGIRAVRGDLADGAGLEAAVRRDGPEWIVHLAAETGVQRDRRAIAEVNVEGTRRLIAAAAAAGIRRCLFVSTVVTGEARGALLTEDSSLPIGTEYGRSKQAGEQMIRAAPFEHVVVRPSHVYGRGGWFASDLVARLKAPGRFVVVGRGDNWWDVVHVADAASAVADALERAPSGALYHVVDDEPITQYDFAALTARAIGCGSPRRVPAPLARLLIGSDPVRAATRSARSSNALVKRELGWAPRFPSAKVGIPAVVAELEGERLDG